jgi:Flp pilus assembly protein TadD
VSERIGNALVSYARYLGKTFWPADLAVFYPHPGHWPVAQVAFAAILVVGLCLGALWFGRCVPFAAMGWFWFFGMLVPTIGFVQVSNQSMADRYTYLPLIGVFIIISWGAAEVLALWRLPKAVIGIMAGLVVAACAVRTEGQLRHWQDGERLFRHALAVTKGNFVAHYNLGNALMHKGQVDEAIAQFRLTLEIRPDYADACCNLGSALLQKGRVNEAIAQFRKAMKIWPDHPLARYNLATTLLQNGRVNEAIAEFQKALKTRPDDLLTCINLGNALLQTGRVDEAIAHYQKALEIQPDYADAHNNLGSALLKKGRTDEAVGHFQRALEIQPNDADAHNHLGDVFLHRGQMDEAIAHYRETLAIQPGYAAAHNNLGYALVEKGRVDEAIGHFQEALKIQPGFAEAHNNLGYVLLQTGHVREAVAQFETVLILQPDNARTMSNLAWVLATCPDASVRNGTRAMELARKADHLNGQDPVVLHALAAAYAEGGRFAEAVTAAQRALQLASAQSNAPLAEMLQSQLKLYQAGSPFRDTGQTGGANQVKP